MLVMLVTVPSAVGLLVVLTMGVPPAVLIPLLPSMIMLMGYSSAENLMRADVLAACANEALPATNPDATVIKSRAVCTSAVLIELAVHVNALLTAALTIYQSELADTEKLLPDGAVRMVTGKTIGIYAVVAADA